MLSKLQLPLRLLCACALPIFHIQPSTKYYFWGQILSLKRPARAQPYTVPPVHDVWGAPSSETLRDTKTLTIEHCPHGVLPSVLWLGVRQASSACMQARVNLISVCRYSCRFFEIEGVQQASRPFAPSTMFLEKLREGLVWRLISVH